MIDNGAECCASMLIVIFARSRTPALYTFRSILGGGLGAAWCAIPAPITLLGMKSTKDVVLDFIIRLSSFIGTMVFSGILVIILLQF